MAFVLVRLQTFHSKYQSGCSAVGGVRFLSPARRCLNPCKSNPLLTTVYASRQQVSRKSYTWVLSLLAVNTSMFFLLVSQPFLAISDNTILPFDARDFPPFLPFARKYADKSLFITHSICLRLSKVNAILHSNETLLRQLLSLPRLEGRA